MLRAACRCLCPDSEEIMNERMGKPEKWINPAGVDKNNFTSDPQDSQFDALKHILEQTNIAYSSVNRFKDHFAETVFNTNLDQLHRDFRDQRYNWLPSSEDVPKEIGGNLPKDYLKRVKYDEALLNMYEHLQKIAVGLEQVVWDQEDDSGELESDFGRIEHELRSVLAEIQMAILEKGIEMRPDVTRKHLPQKFRTTRDVTFKNVRNWLILRDYINTLEYITQVVKHLQTLEN